MAPYKQKNGSVVTVLHYRDLSFSTVYLSASFAFYQALWAWLNANPLRHEHFR